MKLLYLLSIFTAFLGPLFYLFGLTFTTATNATLIGKSEAVLTSLIAVFVLKDKITHHQMVGSCIIFFGVILIATSNFKAGLSFNIGDVMVFLAALSFAIGTILYKKYMHHIEPEVIVTLKNLFGASMLLVVALFIGDFAEMTQLLNFKMIGLLLGLVMCAIVIGQLLFYKALKLTSAVNVSLAGLSSPLIVIMYAMVFLGETLNTSQLLGGGCIFLGLIVLEMHFKKVHTEKKLERHLKIRHTHI